MRRLTVIMLALLVVAGCHRRHHDNAWDTNSSDSDGGPPNVAPDTTRPTVTSTVPANAATGVVIGSTMTATFSEAMLASTISATSFTLVDPALAPVAGAVSYNAATHVASFLPAAPLLNNTVYTARITTAVKDLAGNAMLADYVWSFTTELDTTPPTVVSTNPATGPPMTTGVLVYSPIVATFSEAMLASTIVSPATSFTVTDPLLASVAGVVTYNPVTFAASFQPTANLAVSTVYTATISVAVTDVAGNAMLLPYTWSFTTSPDGIRPTVTWTSPADRTSIWPVTFGSATGVATNHRLAASFSEAMRASTIDVTSFKVTSAPGAVAVTGAVSYDAANRVAYFLPTGGTFAGGTTFTATITTAVTDLAGNAMLADYVWSFTTGASADAVAPAVHCTIPDGGDVSAVPPKLWPTNRKIEAYFDEPMFSPTISITSFTVMNDTLATPVTGTVSYDATNYVASFRPVLPFAISSDFTATITTAVTDLAGNTMALPYTWSFRTSALTDVTAPSVTTTIPFDTETGVPINTRVTALFDEPMDSSTFTTTTFTFTLQTGLTPVLGRVVCPCSGTSGTFIPAADLLPSTSYTATVTIGVKDLAGNTLAINKVWTFTTGLTFRTGQANVPLGAADPFAVLAGSTITNTGPTIITGDVGLSAGSSITGFPPGIVIGTMYPTGIDPTVVAAKSALTAAFGDAASRATDTQPCPAELGGLTLAPGSYTAGSTGIGAGILTLDAQGDENAVWVFRISSTLITIGGTEVVLSGGAQAKNVFWQVSTSATLGTTSIFKGNVLASSSVSLLTGATLEGRALTQVGAVSLDSAVVTKP